MTNINYSHKNRLQFEKSPYLLQHASNPVDWYPWGEAAFETARREDKPIFLSIGYSTCHWCHVMAHESFEDPEVAHFMNDLFVCIKVDREERPDIDHLYMTVCQMMTGSGGWPLSIIMTPEKQPFFSGTYIPREAVFGRMGMLDLMAKVLDIWQNHRQEVLQVAEKITRALEPTAGANAKETLSPELLTTTFTYLKQNFDAQNGGFGAAPKFPTPHNLAFLLRFGQREPTETALQMVEKTLQAMRLGGIYDQLGFGFHRYSTDSHWLLPHFEKMLYDQALLALVSLETFQVTQNHFYAQTAQEIFTYVLREMTAPEGGFYSAEDADSDGEEGKFYLWSPKQLRETLGADEAEWLMQVYNVTEGGNFFDQATQAKTGANILWLARTPSELAGEWGLSETEFRNRLESNRQKLFQARTKRVPPHKDDKILTDWNGLMLAALARGYQVLGQPEYLAAAEKCAEFVLERLRTRDGRLLHRYRDGQPAIAGHLDDYAFFSWGLLELYAANFESRALQTAQELTKIALNHFWDNVAGGFFFSPDDARDLLVRQKLVYDGAIPSGNSVALMNLLRLTRMTGNPEFERKADQLGRAFAREINSFPAAHTQFMSALSFTFGQSIEVVIAGNPAAADTQKMLHALRSRYLPNLVVLLRPDVVGEPDICRLAEFTKHQRMLDGKATAYVCQNFQCQIPTTDSDEMLKFLGK
jgi:uncharacterized protein YyaL (SSP411 family)